jgi:hypothetical protein
MKRKKPNFTDRELKNVMSELLGSEPDEIKLCVKKTVKTENLDYGTPARTELECRPVWGYVLRGNPLIAINKTEQASTGTLMAYIYCREVGQEDLKPETRLLYQGRSHQIELSNVIYDAGLPQFLECKLIQEQSISEVVKEASQQVQNLSKSTRKETDLY